MPNPKQLAQSFNIKLRTFSIMSKDAKKVPTSGKINLRPVAGAQMSEGDGGANYEHCIER